MELLFFIILPSLQSKRSSLLVAISLDSFFSAVEELDPTLAVVLDRPSRFKDNKIALPGLLTAQSDSFFKTVFCNKCKVHNIAIDN